jgi:type III pantothenate kinase
MLRQDESLAGKGRGGMLLAIDVGNSTTSVGLFDRDRTLRFLASLDTDSRKTADQISIDLMNLFALYHFSVSEVSGAIFASVVPPLNFMMTKALTRLLGKRAHDGGPRRQDRTQHPHGDSDPGRR